jgi:thioesterase domain-containing protein
METKQAPSLPDGVVRIKAGGARAPFFYLHGQYDGAGFYTYRMGEALSREQPFYALDSFEFGDPPAPPPLEEMAAHHVRSVRAVAPHGPYILGGWCAGGLLAFEMTRQLETAGEKVEHLLLLDPVYLRYPGWLKLTRRAVERGARLRTYLDARHAYRGLRHRAAYVRSGGFRATQPAELPRDDYPGVYDWTAMEYRPAAPPAARTTFLWTSNRPSLIHGFRVTRYRPSWRSVETAPGVEARTLPFNHWTALNDDLESLARQVAAALSQDET